MFQHLEGWVELKVVMRKGKPFYIRAFSWDSEGLVPLTQSGGWLQLYVHPKTGVLLQAPRDKKVKKHKPKVVVKLGPLKEFRKRNGIWYYVEWAAKPARGVKWDTVVFTRAKTDGPWDMKTTVYYKELRQLNSRELRRHTLQNG
jgi:hypothetical protein